MSNFVIRKPEFSDHIRVNRGLYYHHGIYVSDDVVIAFGSTSNELNPNDARVIITSLDEFLKGGTLEVREYTIDELKRKRSNIDIVNYAYTQLGKGGYNLLTNNCEHFCNECVFDKKESDQINNIKDTLFNIFK